MPRYKFIPPRLSLYGSLNIQAIRWTANARASGAKLYLVNEDTIFPRACICIYMNIYVLEHCNTMLYVHRLLCLIKRKKSFIRKKKKKEI